MKKKYMKLLIIFILGYIILGFIQFQSQNIVGTDAYYHIKYSYLTRTEGLILEFPWWQTSVFSDGFADEYLFYHILLIPFTFFNLLFAAKLSSVFFGALVVATMYFVLQGSGVKWPFLWSLLFLVSSTKFLYRLCFPRAIALSIIIMLLLYFFLQKKKYWAQFILAFIFVWSFPGFYFAFGLLFVYLISNYFLEKQVDKKAIYYIVAGISSGIIINPYFPANVIVFYAHGIHMILSFLHNSSLNVINENKAPTIVAFFKNSLIAHISFLFGIISLFVIRKKCSIVKQKKALFTLLNPFLITGFFFVLGLYMIRAVDYFVPFIFVFCSLSITIALKCLRLKKKHKKFLPYFIILLLFYLQLLVITILKNQQMP